MRGRGGPPRPVATSTHPIAGLLAALAGLATTACDLDSPAAISNQGPSLQVTRTYPAAGEGLGCTGDPDCGVPTTTTVELALDRYLLPRTGIRQSVRLHLAGSEALLFLHPDYDPIERVMRYRPGSELVTDSVYTFEILIPDDSEDGDKNGLRAFDEAPVGEGPVPLTLSFRTRPVRGPTPPPPPPTPTCEEIQEILTGGCAFSNCHGPCNEEDDDSSPCEGPAMGLELATAADWRNTAIGHVAHQTEIGPRAGITLQNPSRFGVEMAIIDAGRPSNSYLMYKLLVNRRSYTDADGQPLSSTSAIRAGATLAPSDAELARLQDWFISLDPMPPADAHLDLASLRKLDRWIQAGAPTHDCP